MTELYRFTEEALVWTRTSADSDQVYNAETYISSALSRNESEQKSDLSKANLEVSVSLSDEMGRRWLRSILDTVVSLTIFNKDGANVNVIWKGRLSSVKPEKASIKLVFESVVTSLRRGGIRGKYQRSCPHVLYGRGCNLDRSDFELETAITVVNGVNVTATEAATEVDGYFTAGMIEAPDGSLRFITKHVGTQLTLIRPLEGLVVGTAKIYPGCDRSKETCKDKFNNIENNGGFPFIPINNPLAGNSIV